MYLKNVVKKVELTLSVDPCVQERKMKITMIQPLLN